MLADPDAGVDAALGLEALAQELGAPAATTPPRAIPAFAPGGQPLDPDNLGRAMAAFMPEDAIVVNEAGTTGFVWSAVHAADAAPHTMLGLTGGAIGQGLPTALGAALARWRRGSACSVRTDGELADALTRALAERGPSLIEAVLA